MLDPTEKAGCRGTSEAVVPVGPVKTPDAQAALDFLLWFAPEGPWILDTCKRPNRVHRCIQPHQTEQVECFLRDNARRDIYVLLGIPHGLPNGQPKKELMVGSQWLWVDLDPPAEVWDKAGGRETAEGALDNWREKTLARVRVFTPAPTAILSSGRGIWALWRLNTPVFDRDQVEAMNKGLIGAFGEADSCWNINRVGRLPGTINSRTGEVARVLERHDDRLYPAEAFATMPATVSALRHDLRSVTPRRVSDLDELAQWDVPVHVRVVINQGRDPDDPGRWPSRSEAVLYVCCQLVRQQVPDDVILGILTDPELGISDSIFRTSDGQSVPSPEKYARRQVEQAHKKVAEAALPDEGKCADPIIAEMNAKHAVLLQEAGKTRVLSWERSEIDASREVPVLQTFEDFRNRYMHRHIQVAIKDNQPIMAELGKTWLKYPHRREYLALRFLPGKPPEVDGYLNLWRGFGVEPVEGDWSLMEAHVRNVLAAGDVTSAEYILNWTAWAVQHPDEPAEVALVFKGGRGTGKGMYARALKRLFGQHGLQVTSPMQLTGRFNAHLRDCCLLFADEAIVPGDKAAESVLKGLITEPELTIEGKGVNAVQARNYLHVVMASNDDWVVPAGMDERRFAVFEVSGERAGKHAYFQALHQQMQKGGLSAMLYSLLRRPLGDWHPRHAVPRTAALQQQKELSLSPLDQFLLGALEEGLIPGAPVTSRDGTVFSNDRLRQPGLYTCMRRSSPRLRDVSDQRLARALKEWGCERYTDGSARGWTFPPLPEMRATWDQRFGNRQWSEVSAWAVGSDWARDDVGNVF